jgi:hypothetical protein
MLLCLGIGFNLRDYQIILGTSLRWNHATSTRSMAYKRWLRGGKGVVRNGDGH